MAAAADGGDVAEMNLKLRKKLKAVLAENKALEDLLQTNFKTLEAEMARVRGTQDQIVAFRAGPSASGASGSIEALQAELNRARARERKLQAQLEANGGSGGGSGGGGGGGGEGTSGDAERLRAELAAKEAELETVRHDQAVKEAAMKEWLQREMANAGTAREREALQQMGRVQELESQLSEQTAAFEKKLKSMQTKLTQMSSSGEDKIKTVKILYKRHQQMKADWATLKGDAMKQKDLLSAALREFGVQIEQQVKSETARTRAALKKYRVAVEEKNAIYDQMQQMKGNIRVYCRVRPLLRDETSNVTEISTTEDIAIRNPDDTRNQRLDYKFDRVFGMDTRQEEIFEDTRPLITSVLDGYNVCIFAYGQTGSGKTFTMEGPPSNPGVNRRALDELFRIAEARKEDYRITITVSNLEIYRDNVYDLLVKTKKGAERDKLTIRDVDGLMTVPGLTEIECATADEVMQVLAQGSSNRATFATDMNEHSSRSHMLLQVVVRTQNVIYARIATVGKLSLVDLAGSERVGKSGVTETRFKEAQSINTSLTALGNLIEALAREASYLPYRETKLTWLLRDSVGGNSKTLMFVQVSPNAYNFAETKTSLDFATRVRTVKLQMASVTTVKVDANVAQMQEELARLRLAAREKGKEANEEAS